jgi:hypothetical protein
MAELVKQENDLVAIKLRLAGPDGSQVRVEVQRAGETRAETSVPARDLGVPPDLDAGRHDYREPTWQLPPGLLGWIANEVEAARGGDAPPLAWVHLAQPTGYLALLPWERMLLPLGLPVLRVPHFASFPPLDTAELVVAICVSQPLARREFDGVAAAASLALAYAGALPGEPAIHLFTDERTHAALEGRATALPPRTTIHDPRSAPVVPRREGGPGFEDSATMAWSPWLHWISHALARQTVEVVHFATHTYVGRNQPALAVSESPVDNVDQRWSRFIGPQQLVTFLDHVGAWAVGLSQPEHNYSPMGARLLVDDLAHRRAGPTILHDLGTDAGGTNLRRLLEAVGRREWPRAGSDITLYAHPRMFAAEGLAETPSYAEMLLAAPRKSAATSTGQPAWVTVARRYMEQAAARRFPDTEQPQSVVQAAAGEGVREAMGFLDGLFSSFSEPVPAATAAVQPVDGIEAASPDPVEALDDAPHAPESLA